MEKGWELKGFINQESFCDVHVHVVRVTGTWCVTQLLSSIINACAVMVLSVKYSEHCFDEFATKCLLLLIDFIL